MSIHPLHFLFLLILPIACQSNDSRLLEAAAKADSPALHRSLALGATPNTDLKAGETALGLLLNQYRKSDSARRNVIEQDVISLLAHGANPNALHHGFTPLQIATGLGNENIISHLLAHGADPALETRAGLAPIWQCVYTNDFRTSLQLLEAGADPNATDAHGQTPLQYLRARGYIKTPLMLQLRDHGGH